MLFRNIQRSDASRKKDTESFFEFLDRVSDENLKFKLWGLDSWNEIRNFINKTFEDYRIITNGESLRDKESRLKKDRFFENTLFEFFTYNWLLFNGFEICEIDPKLENGRTPDFFVKKNNQKILVEATSWNQSEEAKRTQDRVSGLRKHFNLWEEEYSLIKNYWIHCDFSQKAGRALNFETIKCFLDKNLQSVNLYDGYEFIYEDQNCRICFDLKFDAKKEDNNLFIGPTFSTEESTTSVTNIIKKKRKKYSCFRGPIILVIEARDFNFVNNPNFLESIKHKGEQFYIVVFNTFLGSIEKPINKFDFNKNKPVIYSNQINPDIFLINPSHKKVGLNNNSY